MIDIEFSTIAFTIINLIVLFLLLKKFLIGPLNDVIKKREDMIAGTISDANSQGNADALTTSASGHQSEQIGMKRGRHRPSGHAALFE